ncbi:MAG: hypothetical protein M5U34_06780 [Chloroflexi bacterium]|nr:hypothetical protein [Chloroflexota bacterium]
MGQALEGRHFVTWYLGVEDAGLVCHSIRQQMINGGAACLSVYVLVFKPDKRCVINTVHFFSV